MANPSETVVSPKISPTTIRVYLPEEALQGEEVPSFALWHGTQIDGIRMRVPHGFEVSEVYNVAADDWSFAGDELSVKRLEINGYFGLLLTSKQLEETSKQVEFRWDFYSGEEKFTESKRIHVFRPLLGVEVPAEIRLNTSKSVVANPLSIENRRLRHGYRENRRHGKQRCKT